MEIIPVSNITQTYYKGHKRKQENEQKEFTDVYDDLTKLKKYDIMKVGNNLDIRI